MNHVAVDLGSRKSQFCIRSSTGEILKEGKVETTLLAEVFRGVEKSRVVLEASAEAFAVADMAVRAGHDVNIVPSSLAPSLGVGQRGLKTDKRDAQNLSLASCRMTELPSVHLPSTVARERRALLTSRAALVNARTMLVNSVRGWGRTQLLRFGGTGKTKKFPDAVRAAALEKEHGLPEHIERTLQVLEALNEQISSADKELEALAENDVVCRRLMSVPGVGPVTATAFQSALDNATRFKHAHAVESYVGLTPGESSSGLKTQRLGITAAGSVRVRTALVQAAWCAYRVRPDDPMVQWARNIATRRPVQVAVVALARKMAGILFAIWRDGSEYTPLHQKAHPTAAVA